MRSTQKIWCQHFCIGIHNQKTKKLCKNTDTKHDTGKVVQKYAATKKLCGKILGWKKVCQNYAENAEIMQKMRKNAWRGSFRCVGNRMLINGPLHRIPEGCKSCSKTAIPKTFTYFPGARKKFLSPFKFCHMHKPHFSAYIFRIFPHFPHFSAFFPEPANGIIPPPAGA